MPDPVPTLLASGLSALAETTTTSWTAVAAGTLLTLHIVADDYKASDPSDWSLLTNGNQQGFHGHVFWYKFSNGAETSVTYTIGSAVRSAYVVAAHTNIDNGAGVLASNGQLVNTSDYAYTTPSVIAAAGRAYAVAAIGFSSTISVVTEIDTWLSSFSEIGQSLGTATPWENIGIASLAYDADGSSGISSGATATSTNQPECRSGIIGVWRVSSGGSPQTMTGSTATIATSGVAGLVETEGAVVLDTVSAAITASRSPSLTFAVAAAEDDVVIFWPSATTASQTITEPSGWTNVLGAGVDVETAVHELCCVYHRVTAGEAGQTTWTATNLYDSAVTGTVQGTLVRGVSTTAAIAGTGTISAG